MAKNKTTLECAVQPIPNQGWYPDLSWAECHQNACHLERQVRLMFPRRRRPGVKAYIRHCIMHARIWDRLALKARQ